MKTLSLAAISCVLLLPSLALADEFSDFKIPTHRWHSLSSTFFGSVNRSKNQIENRSEDRRDALASLQLGGEWVMDSEHLNASALGLGPGLPLDACASQQ